MLAAAPVAPYLVLGADKLFTRGDVGRSPRPLPTSGAAGALAVEERPGTVQIREGLVERVLGKGLVWLRRCGRSGRRLAGHVETRRGKPPFELALAFQHAIDAGERVAGIQIGPTRDLTAPVDVLEENFPYLRNL